MNPVWAAGQNRESQPRIRRFCLNQAICLASRMVKGSFTISEGWSMNGRPTYSQDLLPPCPRPSGVTSNRISTTSNRKNSHHFSAKCSMSMTEKTTYIPTPMTMAALWTMTLP